MIDLFIELSNRVAALEKRLAQIVRHGPVEEVNAKEGWIRLNYGDGENGPLLSPKMPYAQFAGGLKLHTPPTKGQQMTAIAANGDPAQAFAVPLTWSDQNASPSDKDDENVLTFGNVRLELRGGELVATVGGASMKITGDAALITVGGVTWELSGSGEATSGGTVKHNGKDIGDTHRHGEVLPGPALTGPPAN